MVCGVCDTFLGTNCILQGTFLKESGFPKFFLLATTKPATKRAKPPPKSAAQSIPMESGEHVQEFKVKRGRTKKFDTEPV